MPTNLLKKYPDLLELGHLNESERIKSLKGIFNRDIEENPHFTFRAKRIRPIKNEEPGMQLLFRHLTTCEEKNDENNGHNRRVFEMDRSKRLHWVRFHIDENLKHKIKVFSTEERVGGRRVNRTYLFDEEQKYVIVLEPQRSKLDYYLLSAYYLNRKYGLKMMKKKMKNCLPEVL